jgi:hypothetical protein
LGYNKNFGWTLNLKLKIQFPGVRKITGVLKCIYKREKKSESKKERKNKAA